MPEHDSEKMTQDKFAEINDALGETLEKFGIKNAIVSYTDPDDPSKVIIFHNSHFYEAAKIISKVSNTFKDRIEEELSGL